MSLKQDRAGDREVFRSTGSLILWWLWAVFAVITLIDLIVQGTGRSAVIMAVLVIAITALVYGCALRPRIVADAGGITVEPAAGSTVGRWEKADAVHASACAAWCTAAAKQDHHIGRAVRRGCSGAWNTGPRGGSAAGAKPSGLWPLPGSGDALRPVARAARAGRAGEPGAGA